jgi:tetratricopeptide (TPR) repeat protein
LIGAASAIALVIEVRRQSRDNRAGGPSRGGESPAGSFLEKGDASLRDKRLRAAEASYLRALELDPTLAEARWKLISIHTLQMRRAEVLDEFETLAGLVPLGVDQALVWGQVRCSIWDPEKVTRELSRFLEADPDDRWVRLALAEGLRQLGKLDESAAVLTSMAESDPDARVIRARLALDRGDEPAARGLLAEGPDNHAGLARLRGRMALARRDIPAAVAHFRASLDAEPDHRDGLLGLIQAYRMAGEEVKAGPLQEEVNRHDALVNLLQRAASSPSRRGDPRLLHDLGAACEALRLVPDARTWYRLAIARDPTRPEAQAALYRIATSSPRTRLERARRPAPESSPPTKDPPMR